MLVQHQKNCLLNLSYRADQRRLCKKNSNYSMITHIIEGTIGTKEHFVSGGGKKKRRKKHFLTRFKFAKEMVRKRSFWLEIEHI